MAAAMPSTTKDLYAQEFLTMRLNQFKKLAMRIKKLILEIVQYYLSTFYPTDEESGQICRDIQYAKTENDEELMIDSYKNFLNFLPIRLRGSIQGKNLFRQPSETDLIVDLAHFYKNDLNTIKAANLETFTRDDATGMSPHDLLILADQVMQHDNTESIGPEI